LLPGRGAEGAVELLQRVQAALAQDMARRGWPVTLSVGAVTFLRPSWDVDQMLRRVDDLMYTAKRGGKGRVEHALVHEGQAPTQEDRRRRERRATARVLSGRTARVRPEGGEAPEELATVKNISPCGVSLHTAARFDPGALLVVEPLSAGPRALLARVVHTAPAEGGWRHGCKLSTPLDADEFDAWIGAAPVSPSALAADTQSEVEAPST
jgi:hypothetical protein